MASLYFAIVTNFRFLLLINLNLNFWICYIYNTYFCAFHIFVLNFAEALKNFMFLNLFEHFCAISNNVHVLSLPYFFKTSQNYRETYIILLKTFYINIFSLIRSWSKRIPNCPQKYFVMLAERKLFLTLLYSREHWTRHI